MSNLLLSLATGMVLITVSNFLLFRFTSLSATQTAGAVALATVGIYVPLAILYWPGADVFGIHLALYLIASFIFGMIMGSYEQAIAEGRAGSIRLHWGPAAIIGFFAVLAVVNSTLVVLADHGLSSGLASRLLPDPQTRGGVSSVFPGTISHDFQKKEAFYNDYLRQVERQRERGWQIQKGWLVRPLPGESAVFQVMARTREGDPLPTAEVTGRFLRPSDSRLDRAFTMQEIAAGVYRATVELPAPGMWNLVLELRKDDEIHEVRASTSVSTPG